MPRRGPLRIKGVTERTEGGERIYQVTEPNALTQLIGWLRFTTTGAAVVYRGQTAIHGSMQASGFRGLGRSGRERLASAIRGYIDILAGMPCTCPNGPFAFGSGHRCGERVSGGRSHHVVSGTARAAIEPLLQHYGVKTRWLDVVDNIWIALWFACHRQVSKPPHAFHLRRSPAAEGDGSMAYIAVLETGELSTAPVSGYLLGSQARLIDLRYAVPSVYLRPHAQHGLLIAPAKLGSADGSLPVLAYVEIQLSDALLWLGSGAMTSSYVLFPPAARDEGFRRLLKAPGPPIELGFVTLYGPSF
jgi:hypothetical protein